MEAPRVWKGILVISLALLGLSAAVLADDAVEKVLTLDHSNFTDVVSKHDFIVVEFYAPWCGHCKALAPEYEKAAAELSSHDPLIVLAKVDANEESNRDLATEFKIQGFPTLKILRNGGKSIQEYKGPREADGIVDYLKKQVGPASTEIKSAEDAASVTDEKKISIIGLFPKFSGEEYESFSAVAEKLRSDYTFGHTLDAKLIPRGDSVDKPTIRLLKPFDELVVDTHDFDVEAIEKFIQQSTVPIVTVWNSDPSNYDYVNKFFDGPNDKAMLFVNFTVEHDAFEPKYKEVASAYKSKGISFMLGDADVAGNAFQYFGLQTEQAPLLIIQTPDGSKYLKAKIKPEELAQWVNDYKEGLVKPFIRSEPIPEANDEPVKVVVRDTLQDLVFNSGKNVLLEFYAPWCGHCKNLAPILDEVAKSYAGDEGVLIAKFDATANDVPKDVFDVQGFPTVYFRSSTGDLVTYDGDRTKEEIIDFIEKNRDKSVGGVEATAADGGKAESGEAAEGVKDEL